MFGMIARLTIASGKRDEAIGLLAESTRAMPGCFSYVIAEDAADPDVLWVTEVWESRASHDASFSLRAVQEALPKIRPLVAHFEKVAETDPVTGIADGQAS